LKFPDDTQVRVNGLVEIMADLYAQGRSANDATAEEILDRLEAQKNYIPSSDRIRREYAYVLLKEYRSYLEERTADNLKR
jgi:hypothetical protein